MPLSEAQKETKKRWDTENMTNLAIRIRKSYADEIRERCRENETTPSAIMRKAIDDFMDATRPKAVKEDLPKPEKKKPGRKKKEAATKESQTLSDLARMWREKRF